MYDSSDYLTKFPETTYKPRTCSRSGKFKIASIITVWTVITWIFTGYIINEYIIHPNGPWNTLPHLCCEPIQKIPIFIHIIGSILMLLLGPLQLSNALTKPCTIKFHKYIGTLFILGAAEAAKLPPRLESS